MGHGELPLSAFVRAHGQATRSQPRHRSLGTQLTHSISCTSEVINSSVPWVLCSVSLLLHLAPRSCTLKVDSARLASPQLMACLSGSPKTQGRRASQAPSCGLQSDGKMRRAVPLLPSGVDLGRDRHTGWGVRTWLNFVGPSGWWRGAPHKGP